MQQRQLINTTEDKILAYKCRSGVGVLQMSEYVGEEFVLADVVQSVVQKENSDTHEMEEVVMTCLVSDQGVIYQTLSPTVADSVEVISDIFNIKQDKVRVKVVEGKSNNNRKFLQIDMVSVNAETV